MVEIPGSIGQVNEIGFALNIWIQFACMVCLPKNIFSLSFIITASFALFKESITNSEFLSSFTAQIYFNGNSQKYDYKMHKN